MQARRAWLTLQGKAEEAIKVHKRAFFAMDLLVKHNPQKDESPP